MERGVDDGTDELLQSWLVADALRSLTPGASRGAGGWNVSDIASLSVETSTGKSLLVAGR